MKNFIKEKVSKVLKKENFSKIFRNRNISIIIILSISTYFFIFFQVILISVFSRLSFLYFAVFLLWQLSAVSINIIIILLSLYYKYFRVIFLLFVLIVSGASIFFVFLLNSLFFLKAFLITIFTIALIGFYFSMKYFRFPRSKNRKIILLTILLLNSLTITNICFLTIPRRSILIKPKVNSELIFLTDPYYMPSDNETYEMCKKYNIGFMAGVSERTFNKSSLMDRFKLAISYKVNLYFYFVTPPDTFINLDNTKDYISLYEDYRQWFIQENILDSRYIKAFCFDAEPPRRYKEEIEDIEDNGIINTANYYIDRFPTEREIDEATKNVKKIVDMIHSDGKNAGIIRTITTMDENDGDRDIELTLRNIFSLDVEWDFSMSMIYRTERQTTKSPRTIQNIFSDIMTNIIGGISNPDDDVMSAYNFYHQVGIEQSKGDINADDQYILIGNLKEEFSDTKYIENKDYLDDLDICRHFNEEKVFFYNYRNFLEQYGKDELKNLGEHNQQKKAWKLYYFEIETQTNIVFNMVLVFIDRLLFFDI